MHDAVSQLNYLCLRCSFCWSSRPSALADILIQVCQLQTQLLNPKLLLICKMQGCDWKDSCMLRRERLQADVLSAEHPHKQHTGSCQAARSIAQTFEMTGGCRCVIERRRQQGYKDGQYAMHVEATGDLFVAQRAARSHAYKIFVHSITSGSCSVHDWPFLNTWGASLCEPHLLNPLVVWCLVVCVHFVQAGWLYACVGPLQVYLR